MVSSKHLSALVLGLASLAAAAPALEARNSVPEVIPGPGLPSLESLGLTSEMLYAMGVPESCNPLSPSPTSFLPAH